MSLARITRPLANARTLLSQTRQLPALSHSRRYATDVSKTSADGASDKSTKDAEPKILNRSPPQEHKAGEEVQQHNKEMQNRADKPSERVKDEDIEKDKVNKGFWSGQTGAGD